MVLGGSSSPPAVGTCPEGAGRHGLMCLDMAVPDRQGTLGPSQVRPSLSPRLRNGSGVPTILSS